MSIENEGFENEDGFLDGLFESGSAGAEQLNEGNGNGDGGSGDAAGQNGNQGANLSGQQNQNTGLTPKEIFGEDAGDDWDGFKSKVNDWRKSAEELPALKQKLEQAPVENPFADEEIAAYNSFVKGTGIKNYNTFQYVKSLNLENADPVEVMVIDQVISNPSLIGKEAILRDKLLKDNGLDPNSYSAEEIEVNRTLLQSKVTPLVERIKQLQSTEFKPMSKQDYEAGLVKNEESIKPVVLQAVSEITSIPVIAKSKDGKEIKVLDFDVDANLLAEKSQKIAATLARQGYTQDKMTKEVLEIVRNAAKREILAENFQTIVHAAIKQRESEIEQMYDIQLNNPSAINRGNGNATGMNTGSSNEDQFLSNLLS